MGKKSKKPTDIAERKSSHVPGQYLGYALQPTRLLSLALDAAQFEEQRAQLRAEARKKLERTSGQRLGLFIVASRRA